MSQNSETVDHGTLQRMSAAGVVTGAKLIADAKGWALIAQIRRTQYALAAKRGGVRHWSKMESAARYLHKLGITEFRVDARKLDSAASAKTARPDSSAKLKAAHEAAAYDSWFREQVQIGLTDGKAGRLRSHEDVMSEAEQRLEARIAARAN